MPWQNSTDTGVLPEDMKAMPLASGGLALARVLQQPVLFVRTGQRPFGNDDLQFCSEFRGHQRVRARRRLNDAGRRGTYEGNVGEWTNGPGDWDNRACEWRGSAAGNLMLTAVARPLRLSPSIR